MADYDAFISYGSTAWLDRKLAFRLQRRLEAYRVPRSLVKQGIKRRLGRVFRDRDDLRAGALGTNLKQALVNSDSLIVVCSPETPGREWVNEEVGDFLALGREGRIMLLLVEAEPGEEELSFPPALQGKRILAADVRAGHFLRAWLGHRLLAPIARLGRLWKGYRLLEVEKFRLLAQILGCELDDLRRRQQERFIRRLIAATSALGVLAVVLAGLLGALSYLNGELGTEIKIEEGLTKVAQAAQRRAQSNERESRRRLIKAYDDAATVRLDTDDAIGALPPLAEALVEAQNEPDPDPMHRTRLATVLRHGVSWVPDRIWEHPWEDMHAEFSRDGRLVLAASRDGLVRVWDATTGEPAAPPIRQRNGLNWAAFRPDGRRLVTAGPAGARVWDVASGTPITPPLPHDAPLTFATYSPDGTRLLTVTGFVGQPTLPSVARVWDAERGTPSTPPMAHATQVHSAAFGPDGRTVATAAQDGAARIWDATDGHPIAETPKHAKAALQVEFSPDGGRIVTASADETARIWYSATGQPATDPLRHRARVNTASFSRDGRWVVTASYDRTARIWSAVSGQPRKDFSDPAEKEVVINHAGEVVSASFSPDGRRVVTSTNRGDDPGEVHVWDAATGKALSQALEHRYPVGGARFDPEGHRILVTTGSFFNPNLRVARAGEAGLWDAHSATPTVPPLAMDRPVSFAAFDPQGRRVVIASGWYDVGPDGQSTAGGEARVHDATTLKPIGPPLEQPGSTYVAAFSSDGRLVVTGSNLPPRTVEGQLVSPGEARVWESDTGRAVTPPMPSDGGVGSVAFSADDRWVVTGGSRYRSDAGLFRWQAEVRVWDAATGMPVTPPLKLDGPLLRVNFGPGGRLLTISKGDKGGSARAWDVATALPVGPALALGAEVSDASFSPDGTRVVVARGDGTVQVWDAASARPVGPAMKHRDRVNRAAFSPDGGRIVTASDDRSAQVWDAATGRALGPALGHDDWVVGAQFSPDGRRVVTTCDRGPGLWQVRAWDAASGQPVGPPIERPLSIKHVASSPDGLRLCIGTGQESIPFGGRGEAWLWEGAAGGPASVVLATPGAVDFATFSPGDRQIVAACGEYRPLEEMYLGEEGMALIGDAATGEWIGPPLKHTSEVVRAAFDADGRHVTTLTGFLTRGAGARRWEIASGRPLGGTPRRQGEGTALDLAPGGRFAAIATDKSVQVWDLHAVQPFGPPLVHDGGADSAHFDDSCRRVVTTAFGPAYVWEVATGQRLATLRRTGSINGAAFSADGSRLVTAGGQFNAASGEAIVWDLATKRPIGKPMVHGGRVSHAAFSRDGLRVVTASDDGTARIWDAATGDPVTPPLRHDAKVNRAAFSPDPAGRLVVTAGDDGTARVWDAASGDPVTPPLRHADKVIHAEFSHDGRRIISASNDRTSRLWDISTTDRPEEDLIARARVLSGRRVDRFGALVHIDPDELRGLWRTLRARYPGDFAASPQDVVAWHRREAALCEVDEEWEAMAWHLGHVIGGRGATWATYASRARAAAERIGLVPAKPDDKETLATWTEAVADYSAAIEAGGQNWWVYSERSIAHRVLGQEVEARADFDVAVRLAPDSWWLWWRQGQARSGLGQAQGAVDDFTRLLALEPDLRRAWYGRGAAYARLGRWKEAVDDFTGAIDRDSRYQRAYFDRGMAYINRGLATKETEDFTKAIADFTKVTDDKPGNADAWYNRGLAHENLGQWEPAADNYGRASELEPKNWLPRYKRGVANLQRSHWSSAVEDFTKVLDLKPDPEETRSQVWFLRGYAHANQKEWRQARDDYLEAAKLQPNDWDVWFNLAGADVQLRQWDEADDAYQRAIDLKPGDWQAWYWRGIARAEREGWKQALDDVEKARDLGVDDDWSLFAQTILRFAAGDETAYRQACASFIRRAAPSPDATTLYLAARSCVLAPDALPDYAGPIRMAEGLTKRFPKNYSYAGTLGAILYRAGRYEDATRQLGRATALYEEWRAAYRQAVEGPAAAQDAADPTRGGTAFDWLFLAMAHHRLGHADEARRWLDRAARWMQDRQTGGSNGIPAATGNVSQAVRREAQLWAEMQALSWSQRLELPFLRREAEGLLHGLEPKPPREAPAGPGCEGAIEGVRPDPLRGRTLPEPG
jgi:WD40 repeat protein/tetratricopeptide (TPR) repeat protein